MSRQIFVNLPVADLPRARALVPGLAMPRVLNLVPPPPERKSTLGEAIEKAVGRAVAASISFGSGSAFVLCPSDVLVKELVVGSSLRTFELARLDAPNGLEFEGAGDGHWWRQRDTGSEGRCVWWVCSVLWKSGVSVAYCNIILRFGSTIRMNSFVTFRKCWFPIF